MVLVAYVMHAVLVANVLNVYTGVAAGCAAVMTKTKNELNWSSVSHNARAFSLDRDSLQTPCFLCYFINAWHVAVFIGNPCAYRNRPYIIWFIQVNK